MRERFIDVTTALLDENERVALILADISNANFRDSGARERHPDRVVNMGIREQQMIGFAAGMAAAGFRPIAHSYTPFLIERPFEQIKIDFSHQDLGGILVSIGASYDASASGRTHQSPGDVALMSTLPDWQIGVPGHADEVESMLRDAVAGTGRHYIRLSDETNESAITTPGISVVRSGSPGSPTILAVGPTLAPALEATSDIDVTVLYTNQARPFARKGLAAMVGGQEMVLIEPYLAGTLAAEVSAAVIATPHRLLSLGVGHDEFRKYGTGQEHRAGHGLDAAGIRRSLESFIEVLA
ncbi:MAG: transketolase [Chloroflexi bacterium]|nr:transketolase [Chloroflexota bacterium]